MSDLWILRPARAPWGDYGRILVAGMSAHLPRKEGLIQLERTGPFIPPVSFPGLGDIVVAANFRAALESSGLTGISFQPVIKARIVELNWPLWDSTSDDPAEYPAEGAPEDYILARPHSDEVSAQLGDVWELVAREVNEVSATARLLPDSGKASDSCK